MEQKTAVLNIIECSNGQIPYILDGPPGVFLAFIRIYSHLFELNKYNLNALFSVLWKVLEKLVQLQRQ